jgi:uroporphyrinogen decarboxylase
MTDPAPAVVPDILKVLAGETLSSPPVWFMRQAGRSLPEYRALREKAPDFIAFCFNPQMAAEATMQPMRRFPMDAAIVFADILLLPIALGQKVWFEAGEGPRLGELPSLAEMERRIEGAADHLSNVGETLTRVRSELEPERALIGFAGAPWTVATYMLEGRGGDRAKVRTLAYTDPEKVDGLIDILVESTARYLAMQAKAGAQVLKLFESWAEHLSEDMFERLVIGPHARIVRRLRELGVTAPVIGFPRSAGSLVERYAHKAGVDCVALDETAAGHFGRRLQQQVAIQGALDNLLLRAGGLALDRRIEQMRENWGDGPWIFNLGHGVLPDTPIAHIEQALARIKAPS